jgi:hypothetical protein
MTEIMHWRTPYDRSPKCTSPISLNDNLFFPIAHLKLLVLWFSPTLSTHHHFQQRFSEASKTFYNLQTLSHRGTGFTAYNARTLTQAVSLPILLYDAEVFILKAGSFNKLNTIWT